MKPLRIHARPWAALLLLAVVLLLAAGCPEEVIETSSDTPDIDPPDMPQTFDAEASRTSVTLTWDTLDEDDNELNKDLEGVLLVRSADRAPDAYPVRETEYAPGAPLGYGEVLAVLTADIEEYVDENVEAGVTYYYELFTFDEVPNYSESASLTATPGSLVWARFSHSQTDLGDGTILLAGGIGYAGPLVSAEIFDPAKGFRAAADEMNTTRFAHTATLLDDGSVVVIGGYESGFAQTLATAESFDPVKENFTKLDNEMELGRALHTATLLPDGTVLVVGGTDGVDAMDTMELYDPTTQSFTTLDDVLSTPRYGHQALLLEDRVIIFGGFDAFESVGTAVAVQLDTWQVTDLKGRLGKETAMQLGTLYATLSALPEDKWLLAGGYAGTLGSGEETAGAEIFDPAANSPFALTGSLAQARSGHRAAVLPDATVLVVGGISPDLEILDGAEIYDAATGEFTGGGHLRHARTVPEVNVLEDGRVLIAGGNGGVDVFQPEPISTAEIYNPSTGKFTVVGVTSEP